MCSGCRIERKNMLKDWSDRELQVMICMILMVMEIGTEAQNETGDLIPVE